MKNPTDALVLVSKPKPTTPERVLEVVIRGGCNSGKTTLAVVLAELLERLEGHYTVHDEPNTKRAHAMRLEHAQDILSGTMVRIRTEQLGKRKATP